MADAKIVYTAEDRTGPATASVKKGLAQVNELATAAGLSFAALGAAGTISGIVAAVTQITKSIDAFNDLKDATGASIENISGLENVARATGANFDTVSTSLIKFNQALGATVKPGSDAEKVIKAIGLNAKDLRDIDPAEALRQTAVALSAFADDGNKARAVQELFGKSLKEVAPFLKDLAEAGQLNATVTTKQAEEAEKFNKELFKMQATLGDVGRAIANPLVTNMNELIGKFRDGQREGESFTRTLLRMSSQLPGIFGAGGKLLGGYEALAGKPNGYTTARTGIANIDSALNDQTLGAGERQALIAERARLVQQRAGYLNSTAGGGRGMGGYGDVAKGSIDLPADPDKPKAGKKAAQEMTEAERDLEFHIKQRRKAFLEAHDAEQKAIEEIAKSYQQLTQAADESGRAAVVAINERRMALESEIENYGKLQSAIEETKLARLRDDRAAAAAGADRLDMIDAQIEAQGKLVDTLRRKEVIDANRQTTDAVRADWERTNQSIADSFVDNLMRGGKSVAQYLKDLFRTLVLRPLLQPVGQAVAGMVGSMMPGGAQAGGLNLGNVSSLISGGMSVGNSIATGFANITGTGLDGLMAATGSFGTAGGIMGTIGAAMPYIGMAIMAISLLKDAFKGEKRSGGQYNRGSLVAAPTGGEIGEFGAASGAMAEAVNATLKQLGSSSQLTNFMTGVESSERGKGFAYAGGTLNTGGVFGQGWGSQFVGREGIQNRRGDLTPEQAAKAGAEELKQAYLQAIQAAIDIPQSVAALLEGKDIDAMAEKELDGLITQINNMATAVDGFSQVVAALPFENLKGLTFDWTAALVEAAGGLERLTGNLSSFYENYFTEEERRAHMQAQLASTFEQLGVTMPTTLQQFRELVLAQDLTTEAGRQMYARLLEINGAFHEVNGTLEETAAVIETVAEATQLVYVNVGDLAMSAAQAAQAAAAAWDQTAKSIADEMARLRGDIGGTAGASMASARAQFAIATAQARAGDQAAADTLPGLSQRISEMGRRSARSSFEASRVNANLAGNLGGTLGGIRSRQWVLGQTGSQFGTMGGGGGASVEALRADLQAQSVAIVAMLRDQRDIFRDWQINGLPDTRIEA